MSTFARRTGLLGAFSHGALPRTDGWLGPANARPSRSELRAVATNKRRQESVNAGRDQATKGATEPRFSRTAAFKRRLNLAAQVSPPSVP